MFRNLIERLLFPILCYSLDEQGNIRKYIDKKISVGLIYTMNCTKENAEMFNYPTILNTDRNSIEMLLGPCEVLFSHNTWQFPDYAKYDSDAVDVAQKEWFRDNQFPKDKQAAYDMGKRMISQCI